MTRQTDLLSYHGPARPRLLSPRWERAAGVGEEQRTGKHQPTTEPVLRHERVGEVPDREEQAGELTQRDDQRDHQRGTLLGEAKHHADAQVSEKATC